MDEERDDVKTISKLAYTRDGTKTDGAIRVYQRPDGSFEERVGGTAAWRHNNPGNLKFEYAHSADQTVHNSHSKEQALSTAQNDYLGVIDLDQRGNVIFESVEKGHAAQLVWINRNGYKKTVPQMLGSYSKADYSGPTHYTQQEEMIYKTGDSRGFDLRTKLVSNMTPDEKEALAAGISKFEGWQEGKVNTLTADQVASLQAGAHLSQDAVQAPQATNSAVLRQGMHSNEVGQAQDQLHTLGYLHGASDNRFGAATEAAVQDFQRAQGLESDGRIGPLTHHRLDAAVRDKQISDLTDGVTLLQDFSDPTHPHSALFDGLKDALPQPATPLPANATIDQMFEHLCKASESGDDRLFQHAMTQVAKTDFLCEFHLQAFERVNMQDRQFALEAQLQQTQQQLSVQQTPTHTMGFSR